MNTDPLIEHNQLAYLHMFEMIILHGVPLVARGYNFIELEDHQIKIQSINNPLPQSIINT